MNANTLYEDWQNRREFQRKAGECGYARAQVKILNYLLARYKDSPEGLRPARFPLVTEARFDRRAIVVHNHLGHGKIAGIKSEAEAGTRASRLLRKIKNSNPQADAKAPRNLSVGEILLPAGRGVPQTDLGAAQERCRTEAKVRAAIGTGFVFEIYSAIESALEDGGYLPQQAMEWLYSRIRDRLGDAGRAICKMSACKNTSVVNYTAIAWRDLISNDESDELIPQLEAILHRPQRRDAAAERIRVEMANDNAAVRRRALLLLQDFGDLNDIALLSDLLALPPLADEYPEERQAMLAAMEKLAAFRDQTIAS